MRIGIFAHRLGQRQPTGLGRYLLELVTALADAAGRTHTILLASTREADGLGSAPDAVETRVLPWPRRPVQAAWCLGTGPHLETHLGSLDVAHLIQPFPPVRTVSPQVLTLHDLFPFDHPEWYPRSERWTYRRSMALLLQRVSRIIVPSRYVAQLASHVLDIEPNRLSVVPHGVSGAFSGRATGVGVADACARLGLNPGGFAVCVGAVSSRKNVSVLIQAMAQLRWAQIPLVIIGSDGHGAESVKAELARLNGSTPVLRPGYLPDDDMAALVRGAAVLMHPALAEGFGLVPLEAMAAGTPVIAARSSSIPEVVGDAAIMVDEPTNPRAWADSLIQLMDDADLREALAAAGIRRAATFSWERTARMMLEIYEDARRC